MKAVIKKDESQPGMATGGKICSRRDFLTAMSAAGVALVSFGAKSAVAASGAGKAQEALSYESLAEQIGSQFVFSAEGGQECKATLQKVNKISMTRDLHQYSAGFTVTSGTLLPSPVAGGDMLGPTEKTSTDDHLLCSVRHAALGKFDLSLAINRDEQAEHLTATFCQLVGSGA